MSNIAFIGSRISLITKAGIRYIGTLVDINASESTIAVENALSFGTENSPCPAPGAATTILYTYIKLRGSDIVNLYAFGQEQTQDPAIIEASRAPDGYHTPGFPNVALNASYSTSNFANRLSVCETCVSSPSSQTTSSPANSIEAFKEPTKYASSALLSQEGGKLGDTVDRTPTPSMDTYINSEHSSVSNTNFQAVDMVNELNELSLTQTRPEVVPTEECERETRVTENSKFSNVEKKIQTCKDLGKDRPDQKHPQLNFNTETADKGVQINPEKDYKVLYRVRSGHRMYANNRNRTTHNNTYHRDGYKTNGYNYNQLNRQRNNGQGGLWQRNDGYQCNQGWCDNCYKCSLEHQKDWMGPEGASSSWDRTPATHRANSVPDRRNVDRKMHFQSHRSHQFKSRQNNSNKNYSPKRQ